MRIPKSVRHKAIQLQNNDQMPSERKKLVQFCGMWNSVQDDVRASIRLQFKNGTALYGLKKGDSNRKKRREK